MILANPPSYLTAAQFQAQPNDYDLTGYSTTKLQDILNRASGAADAIMRRSLLARERTVRYLGDGSNKLELRENPILYLKRLQIVIPGTTGPLIPLDQILIDYQSGSVLEYTPTLWEGQGYFARFPDGIPVDVTIGYGYGSGFIVAPTWTAVDIGGSGLEAGSYNIAITTRTMWGETPATPIGVATTSGNVQVTINPVLGAYLYRAYASSAANNTTLNGATVVGATTFTLTAPGTIAVGDTLLFDTGANAERLVVAAVSGHTVTTTSGALYAHASGAAVIEAPTLVAESPFTAYGATAMMIDVNSLTPQNGLWPDPLPTTDTSAPEMPNGIIEAVRLLALNILWEQNNLANRGVSKTQSGRKSVAWRSTEGNSGKGVPLAVQQATMLLKPYSLQAIY